MLNGLCTQPASAHKARQAERQPRQTRIVDMAQPWPEMAAQRNIDGGWQRKQISRGETRLIAKSPQFLQERFVRGKNRAYVTKRSGAFVWPSRMGPVPGCIRCPRMPHVRAAARHQPADETPVDCAYLYYGPGTGTLFPRCFVPAPQALKARSANFREKCARPRDSGYERLRSRVDETLPACAPCVWRRPGANCRSVHDARLTAASPKRF